MIVTEMVEVLHVILRMICVLISRKLFQILLNMFFFEILTPKVRPIAIGIFYRPSNETDFLKIFQTSSSKLTAKPMKSIFSETLISTYFKMKSLSSKKISHINLKV